MFFEIFDNFFFFVENYGRVAAAHYGEARAHARPARRGARSTPRGYAPLESSGNGCPTMVAYGNQCEPFSIVTPTRANSEGKLQG